MEKDGDYFFHTDLPPPPDFFPMQRVYLSGAQKGNSIPLTSGGPGPSRPSNIPPPQPSQNSGPPSRNTAPPPPPSRGGAPPPPGGAPPPPSRGGAPPPPGGAPPPPSRGGAPPPPTRGGPPNVIPQIDALLAAQNQSLQDSMARQDFQQCLVLQQKIKVFFSFFLFLSFLSFFFSFLIIQKFK